MLRDVNLSVDLLVLEIGDEMKSGLRVQQGSEFSRAPNSADRADGVSVGPLVNESLVNTAQV